MTNEDTIVVTREFSNSTEGLARLFDLLIKRSQDNIKQKDKNEEKED